MSNFKYKFQMYKHLQAKTPEIYAEARKAADDLGITKYRGQIGLTGAISGCPAPMRKNVAEAIMEGERRTIPLATLVDEIREIVKDVYGDEYDACPVAPAKVAFGLLLTHCSHAYLRPRRQVSRKIHSTVGEAHASPGRLRTPGTS